MQRITVQRKNILESIKKLGHSTIEDIDNELKKEGLTIALSTIYRSLIALEEANVIKRIPSKFGEDYYEISDQQRHDHFMCVKCHKVIDVPKRRISYSEIKKSGKLCLDDMTTYYGICEECLAKDN